MDELDLIYSNATLRQQAAHCSCSTHHRWVSLALTISLSPLCNSIAYPWNPFEFHHYWWPSFKTLMHVESITWNDLYTLLETHGNKPRPKPRPEPPPVSSTVSHGSATNGPEVPDGQSVNSSKSYRDNFGFSGSHGQSASSVRTVRHLRADNP
jgi:hypothetical protein